MIKTYVRLASVLVLAACVLGCVSPHVDVDGKGLDDPYGTTRP